MEYEIITPSGALLEAARAYLTDSFMSSYVISTLKRAKLPDMIRHMPHGVFCDYYRPFFESYLDSQEIRVAVCPGVDDVVLGAAVGSENTLVWVCVKYDYRHVNNDFHIMSIGSDLVRSVCNPTDRLFTPYSTGPGRSLLDSIRGPSV